LRGRQQIELLEQPAKPMWIGGFVYRLADVALLAMFASSVQQRGDPFR
jgi:hypothetical protein